MGQPDLMAGADLGGDAGKFHRQFLDQGRADRGLELGGELLAADQPGAVEADVEIAQDISRLQAARPRFEGVEVPGRIGAADHRPDRGADHDIGDDAMGHQRADDADMGKAARGAAAEREPDDRPPNAAEADLLAAIRAALAASRQNFQHRRSPGAISATSGETLLTLKLCAAG